jgi:hypothetical protein
MWGAIAALIVAPFIAMQFTGEVRWDLADFLLFAALLVTSGILYELAARHLHRPRHRLIAGMAIAAAVFIVWLDAAAGLF